MIDYKSRFIEAGGAASDFSESYSDVVDEILFLNNTGDSASLEERLLENTPTGLNVTTYIALLEQDYAISQEIPDNSNASVLNTFANLKTFTSSTNWVDYSDVDFNTISGWIYEGTNNLDINSIVAPAVDTARYIFNATNKIIKIKNGGSGVVVNTFQSNGDYDIKKYMGTQIIYLTSKQRWYVI